MSSVTKEQIDGLIRMINDVDPANADAERHLGELRKHYEGCIVTTDKLAKLAVPDLQKAWAEMHFRVALAKIRMADPRDEGLEGAMAAIKSKYEENTTEGFRPRLGEEQLDLAIKRKQVEVAQWQTFLREPTDYFAQTGKAVEGYKNALRQSESHQGMSEESLDTEINQLHWGFLVKVMPNLLQGDDQHRVRSARQAFRNALVFQGKNKSSRVDLSDFSVAVRHGRVFNALKDDLNGLSSVNQGKNIHTALMNHGKRLWRMAERVDANRSGGVELRRNLEESAMRCWLLAGQIDLKKTRHAVSAFQNDRPSKKSRRALRNNARSRGLMKPRSLVGTALFRGGMLALVGGAALLGAGAAAFVFAPSAFALASQLMMQVPYISTALQFLSGLSFLPGIMLATAVLGIIGLSVVGGNIFIGKAHNKAGKDYICSVDDCISNTYASVGRSVAVAATSGSPAAGGDEALGATAAGVANSVEAGVGGGVAAVAATSEGADARGDEALGDTAEGSAAAVEATSEGAGAGDGESLGAGAEGGAAAGGAGSVEAGAGDVAAAAVAATSEGAGAGAAAAASPVRPPLLSQQPMVDTPAASPSEGVGGERPGPIREDQPRVPADEAASALGMGAGGGGP